MAPFLGQVGRRKIDRDPPRRQRKTRRHEGRAHALACFGHRLVGQAHDIECGQPGCHLDLDIDRARFDAFERNCCDSLDHACPCFAHELSASAITPARTIREQP